MSVPRLLTERWDGGRQRINQCETKKTSERKNNGTFTNLLAQVSQHQIRWDRKLSRCITVSAS